MWTIWGKMFPVTDLCYRSPKTCWASDSRMNHCRFQLMLTPNKYPTSAVSPIATVPQKVIRKIAFFMLEPPVLSA